MAKWRGSAMVEAASGAVGGVEFISGRGPATVRKRQQKIARLSERALDQKAIYARAVAAYRALTDDQRQAWAVLGQELKRPNSLGTIRTPNAYETFLRMAIPSLKNDTFPLSIPADPAILPTPESLTFLSATVAEIRIQYIGLQITVPQPIQVYVEFGINRPVHMATLKSKQIINATVDLVNSLVLTINWPNNVAYPAAGWNLSVAIRLITANRIPSGLVEATTLIS